MKAISPNRIPTHEPQPAPFPFPPLHFTGLVSLLPLLLLTPLPSPPLPFPSVPSSSDSPSRWIKKGYVASPIYSTPRPCPGGKGAVDAKDLELRWVFIYIYIYIAPAKGLRGVMVSGEGEGGRGPFCTLPGGLFEAWGGGFGLVR